VMVMGPSSNFLRSCERRLWVSAIEIYIGTLWLVGYLSLAL
jgi:hypothetical protein